MDISPWQRVRQRTEGHRLPPFTTIRHHQLPSFSPCSPIVECGALSKSSWRTMWMIRFDNEIWRSNCVCGRLWARLVWLVRHCALGCLCGGALEWRRGVSVKPREVAGIRSVKLRRTFACWTRHGYLYHTMGSSADRLICTWRIVCVASRRQRELKRPEKIYRRSFRVYSSLKSPDWIHGLKSEWWSSRRLFEWTPVAVSHNGILKGIASSESFFELLWNPRSGFCRLNSGFVGAGRNLSELMAPYRTRWTLFLPYN